MVGLPSIAEAYGELVFDAPWNQSRLSDTGKLATKQLADLGERKKVMGIF